MSTLPRSVPRRLLPYLKISYHAAEHMSSSGGKLEIHLPAMLDHERAVHVVACDEYGGFPFGKIQRKRGFRKRFSHLLPTPA